MRVDNLPFLARWRPQSGRLSTLVRYVSKNPLSPFLISEWAMRTGGAFRMQSISLFDKLFE